MVHVDHLKPYEKDYEPSFDNLGLPPLILDEDYLDLVDNQAHNEYMDMLEPLLEHESGVPELQDSEPLVHIPIPVPTPLGYRRSERQRRPPRRFGHSSHPIRMESVFWF